MLGGSSTVGRGISYQANTQINRNMKIWPQIEQRSEEWFRIRAGRATASEFSRILTPGGKKSAQWEGYALDLMAESVAYDEIKWEGNRHTDRGEALEPEALAAFAATLPDGYQVEDVGFVTHDNGVVGCSPDALVKNQSGQFVAGVEIKCPMAKNHVAALVSKSIPEKHLPQVHGGIAVTGLPLWHFVSYHPRFRLFQTQVESGAYTKKLATALDDFVIYYGAMRDKHMGEILP